MKGILRKFKIWIQFIIQQFRLRVGFMAIYLGFWLLMSVMFAAVYPFLADNAASITAAVEAFEGTGVAEAFGITEDYITSAQNFIGGEQLAIMVMVSTGVAVFLGASSIGGAIQNKQIFAFLNKPVTRSELFTLHFITNALTITLLNGAIALITWGSFALFVPDDMLSARFIGSIWVGFSIANILFLAIGQCFSLVLGNSITIIAGTLVGIFGQIMDGLSKIDQFPFIVQLFNPFYYLNTARITSDADISGENMVILLLVTLIFFALGLFLFRNKEIYT